MMENSRCTSSSVRLEVGSSITITLALKATALAISTICFSPMLSSLTGVVGFLWPRFTFSRSSRVRVSIRAQSTMGNGPAFFTGRCPIKIFSRISSQFTTLSS